MNAAEAVARESIQQEFQANVSGVREFSGAGLGVVLIPGHGISVSIQARRQINRALEAHPGNHQLIRADFKIQGEARIGDSQHGQGRARVVTLGPRDHEESAARGGRGLCEADATADAGPAARGVTGIGFARSASRGIGSEGSGGGDVVLGNGKDSRKVGLSGFFTRHKGGNIAIASQPHQADEKR